jgi:hypothetical protein
MQKKSVKNMIDLRPAMENDDIKILFKKIAKSGKIKCQVTGPKENILDCETEEDWVRASALVFDAGFSGASPGAFGSAPSQRTSLYKKMYRGGSLCAVVKKRNILIFRVPTTYDNCLVISQAA